MDTAELNTHAVRLLKFVEENVKQAIADPHLRGVLLTEADGALSVLKRTLHRENEHKFAQYILIMDGLNLTQTAESNPQRVEDALYEDLATVADVRDLIFS